MRQRIVFHFMSFFVFGFLFFAPGAHSQAVAYRQANLASSVPNAANSVAPSLTNPWGMAFLSGQPFFIADNETGRVTVLDASGIGVRPGSFLVPNIAGEEFGRPSGIVADPNSSFGGSALIRPFILVTTSGTVLTWGPDPLGDLPQQATRVIDNSTRGAVYDGAAILNSSLTQPVLAITDFHSGLIDTFIPGFVPVAPPGSFTDPDLPSGYAPFGIQVIGTQVFVTYAVQDAAKHDPIFGEGNGVVNIFDMDGNFVKRFVTSGPLNAPWGITQASANFGPFSNDILIANVGDGTINAFDPTTGQFAGQLLDGDGAPVSAVGLHGLAFRADGFGASNTLYFTSQVSSENDGLFGAISTGLVSTTRISAPNTPVDASVKITVTVEAGPGNPGTPVGTVTFSDGSSRLGTSPLIDGTATLDVILAFAGVHTIDARYSGDAAFLPSSSRIPLQVTGFATTSVLVAPPNAAPGSAVTLTATITSAAGTPTGQVTFLDGNANLGTSTLDDAGVAILRVNTLSAGTHALTASYSGDEKFVASKSAGVTIDIANQDFSLGANPATATVPAGNSAQFALTITPAGGFANAVTFSCSVVTGTSCAFNPATVTPANGAAATTLTVVTSASVAHYGFSVIRPGGPVTLLAALAFLGLVLWKAKSLERGRPSLLPITASLVIVALGLAIGGCGGYGGAAQANRGTASIVVTAQSGNLAHSTTVSVTVQ